LIRFFSLKCFDRCSSHDVSVCAGIGSFNTSYRIAADYDFILRLFSHPEFKAAYIPEVLVTMRIGGASNRSLGAAPGGTAPAASWLVLMYQFGGGFAMLGFGKGWYRASGRRGAMMTTLAFDSLRFLINSFKSMGFCEKFALRKITSASYEASALFNATDWK
jgi:hypothetical protein